MRSVMITCPNTNKPVDTRFGLPYEMLASQPIETASFDCPECDKWHIWRMEEAFPGPELEGQEASFTLVNRFENEHVKVLDLVTNDEGFPQIKNTHFTDCHLIGPAILFPRTDLRWNSIVRSSMLMMCAEGQSYEGLIVVDNGSFDRCTFEHVGIAGTMDVLDRLLGAN
ncbi:hypothetical protein [Phycicoccus avicenniae]|uniref:hypothetical protein n=1 Tax=Phycicoccus avicenniae TaxID=2828860 RepID=UPI003D2D2C21